MKVLWGKKRPQILNVRVFFGSSMRVKKAEGHVSSPYNEDFLCKFVCKLDQKWRQEIASRET